MEDCWRCGGGGGGGGAGSECVVAGLKPHSSELVGIVLGRPADGCDIPDVSTEPLLIADPSVESRLLI